MASQPKNMFCDTLNRKNQFSAGGSLRIYIETLHFTSGRLVDMKLGGLFKDL